MEEWYADVILPLYTAPLTYGIESDMVSEVVIGSRVIVQLGARKHYSGVVWRLHQNRPPFKTVKNICQVLDPMAAITEQQIKLWEWISSYYMSSVGMVMRAALPSGLKLGGNSFEEARDSGYTQPLLHHVKLHHSIVSESDLNDKLNSLSRARVQHGAVMEFLGLVGVWDSDKDVFRGKLSASSTIIKALVEKEVFEVVLREQSREQLPWQPQVSGRGQSQESQLEFSDRDQAHVPGQLSWQAQASDRDQAQSQAKTGNDADMFGDTPKFHVAPLPVFTPTQASAYLQLKESFIKQDVVLLHGVTGSGKTELYIHLIAEQLALGCNALYMLPEIALTAQLIDRLRLYFANRVTVYHSKLSDRHRAAVYTSLLTSQGGHLIVGVRSSVLLPTPRLSLVIVDEEHESSFKQSDTSPRYHARDTATMLASIYGAKTLLGSATPSVESYFNAVTGKYGLVTLSERYSGISLPEVLVSDTLRAAKRGEKRSHFNKLLLDRMEQALSANEQIILFQNRRGFSPYIECGSCGWTASCPDCNVTLTYHKADGTLRCHYCGHRTPIITDCPSCKLSDINPMGFGTEKIEDELSMIFPEAKIDRLDADTTRTSNGYRRIITDFEQGTTDILIGTQMITKGFDFGNVSLVGILNADNLLNYPDFRSGERAFQLMMQVGGRAGRRAQQGTVIIQTSQPSHPIIQLLARSDYDSMLRLELHEREQFLYPPYCRLISIQFRHADHALLWRAASSFAASASPIFGRRLLGPEAPPVDRIRGQHIAQITLKIEKQNSSAKAKELLVKLFDRLSSDPILKSVDITVDVDPS